MQEKQKYLQQLQEERQKCLALRAACKNKQHTIRREKRKNEDLKEESRKHELTKAKLGRVRHKVVGQRQKLRRSKVRVAKLSAARKQLKKEIAEEKKKSCTGMHRMRKGNGPKAHLTKQSIALTLRAVISSDVSPERWPALASAFGECLFTTAQDLKAASGRTVRRMLRLNDAVCLAHEIEEIKSHLQMHAKNLQWMCDISPLMKREIFGNAICYSSFREREHPGPDGHPDFVKRFTRLMLPLVEVPDKEGATCAEKILKLMEMTGTKPEDFSSNVSDGGVEMTGNQRKYGDGAKGVNARVFLPAGALWDWCCNHILSLAFNDSDLSLVHAHLETISRFLRNAAVWSALKPLCEDILDAYFQGDSYPKYLPKIAANRLRGEVTMEEMQAAKAKLHKVSTVLLGEKGRWLSFGHVAEQLVDCLPFIREAIVLRYAKDNATPEKLVGKKNRKPQKVHNILGDSTTRYRVRVAALMTVEVFQPMSGAMGLQNHTKWGVKDGVVETHKVVRAKLQRMLITHKQDKKPVAKPNPEVFGSILATTGAEATKGCESHIVSHVRKVQNALDKRFTMLDRIAYQVAHLTDEEFIDLPEHHAFVSVPTAHALTAAVEMPKVWDALSEEEKQRAGRAARDFFENPGLMQQL